MKILLTGAQGFFGQNALPEWDEHEVTALGRNARNNIVCDLTEEIPTLTESYDLVVHAAGKAHMVPKTEEERDAFFNVNVRGTQNLLKALEKNPPSKFVFISTVAVYGLDEGLDVVESDPLKGETPYAKSKIQAEALVEEWSQRHNVERLILRLPLLSGVNPPGNLQSMFHMIQKGMYARMGEAKALKSVVAVKDVAKFIASSEAVGVYNLADGPGHAMHAFEDRLARLTGKNIRSIPEYWIKWVAKLGDLIPFSPIHTKRYQKLTSSLTFRALRRRV